MVAGMTLLETTNVDQGHYRVREGDDFTKVALLVFGSRRKAVDIANANPDATMEPGSTLKIPGKPGIVAQIVSKNMQFPGLFRAIFRQSPTAGAIKEFQRWNGGLMEFEEGELVFFPDLKPVNYGY